MHFGKSFTRPLYYRSMSEYAVVLLPLSTEIIDEVTTPENLFFQAILQMQSAIKPRILPLLLSPFKLESRKHRTFELQHHFMSRLKFLICHG